MARTRDLVRSCPGGINAAVAWILRGNPDEPEEEPATAEPEQKPRGLRRFLGPNRATCACGCHDYTGEASRCPNCGESLYR